jgi:DNA-binding NtrC family response regulator
MHPVDWQGVPPPEAVQRALARAGFALSAGGGGSGPRVLATRDARTLPASPAGATPWLWVCTQPASAESVRAAVESGAYDVISLAGEGAVPRLLARLTELAAPEPTPGDAGAFIGDSPVTRGLLRQLAQAARTSMPVLLTGETGTGKELAARLIHGWSERSSGPFVPVNCAAIPNELMEGELFGYAKGAFSGAVRRYQGLLSAAAGGTVFLDEIDDTPHPLQVKLLRVLEDRVVTRLGESTARQVDFRILAATNRDLRKLIAAGGFGEDLYERLATVAIQLPPLRERTADIPALVHHFVARFHAEEPGAPDVVESITPEALAVLLTYPWPGNVRELRNVVFGVLVAKRAGTEILLSDLPRRLFSRTVVTVERGAVDPVAVERAIDAGSFNLRREVEQLERVALAAALQRSGGRASSAARLLGEVGRGTASDPGGTVRAMVRRLGLGAGGRRRRR